MASAPPSRSSTAIATAIPADDRDAVDGVHRAAQSGGYCAAKSPPPIEPFAWSVARHPLRPFAHGDSKRIGRVPFPMKRKRPEVAVMVDQT